jgi:hypothetical protein
MLQPSQVRFDEEMREVWRGQGTNIAEENKTRRDKKQKSVFILKLTICLAISIPPTTN